MERVVNTMEENLNRENTMKFWKDAIVVIEKAMKDAIIVIEKTMKAIKCETISSCWRKLCPDVVHDFTGFTREPIKEIVKETVDMARIKGGGWKVSRYGSWRNSKAN